MKLTISTKGWQQATDKLNQRLKQYVGNKTALVGVHEKAGHVEGSPVTMATLGATLNFGTDDGHIPARPWLNEGVKSGTQAYIEDLRNSIGSGANCDNAIERLGALAASATQEYMTELKTPPNAEATIAKKGSDNPLIDTGALRASVDYTVTSDNVEEGLA